MVIVKTLKEVNADRCEFELKMELVVWIRHDNMVELRACYYLKDGMRLVYDNYGLATGRS